MDFSNTIDSLKREVSLLRDKLTTAELKLAEAQRQKMKMEVENVIPFTPRKPFTRVEMRPVTPTSGKRGIKEMVDEVVDGKKRKLGYGGIPFDPEGVRGKGIVVGLKLGGVLWETGIGGVLAALEEAGFILAEGARWLVGEKERARREALGRMSSTVVAFVRGVAEADVILKKGLWLGGRWHSVKRYEAVQPIRVKKGWAWVSERLDEVSKSEGTALRRVNGSVDGIFKAVAEIGREVKEMRMVGQVGGRWEVNEHWSDFLKKKRDEDNLAARMVKGKKDGGISFTSKVSKENDGSSWFPAKAEGPALPPGVAAIATVTPGSKSSGAWATKAEALAALGLTEKDMEWSDED